MVAFTLLLSVYLSGCVTPQGVALSVLARELSTPERGEQRFDLQGRPSAVRGRSI